MYVCVGVCARPHTNRHRLRDWECHSLQIPEIKVIDHWVLFNNILFFNYLEILLEFFRAVCSAISDYYKTTAYNDFWKKKKSNVPLTNPFFNVISVYICSSKIQRKKLISEKEWKVNYLDTQNWVDTDSKISWKL